MSSLTSDYTKLITSEHSDLPIFPKVIGAVTDPEILVQDLLKQYQDKFRLDAAVGAQLDIVGRWIGFLRYLRTDYSGVYFSWDLSDDLGWESGYWQGPYDATTQIRALGDDDYRRLLMTLIKINHWDGSFEQLLACWQEYLNWQGYSLPIWWNYDDQGNPINWEGTNLWQNVIGQGAVLVDNQDMTMSVIFFGAPPVGIYKAWLKLALGFVKPAGVAVREVITTTSGSPPLFGWDTEGPLMMGWQLGEIGTPINLGPIVSFGSDPTDPGLPESSL